MSNSIFVTVNLIPNNQGGAAFASRPVLVNSSAIWEINQRRANDYEVTLIPQLLQLLHTKYFGGNTTIKEVTIDANEFKKLVSDNG